jgi:hypothetical protein
LVIRFGYQQRISSSLSQIRSSDWNDMDHSRSKPYLAQSHSHSNIQNNGKSIPRSMLLNYHPIGKLISMDWTSKNHPLTSLQKKKNMKSKPSSCTRVWVNEDAILYLGLDIHQPAMNGSQKRTWVMHLRY